MRGASLIESVVTLGVVILLITGLVVSMTSSLQSAQASKSRSLAVQYAQEALEIVRQERDSNWNTFASRDVSGTHTDYCMSSSGQLSTPPELSCSRIVTFTKNIIDPGQMDVVVMVSWTEGSEIKNVFLKTTYTQWK